MRTIRLGLALSALLVLTVAAPAAAGQTTINSSSSAITAQAGRESYDEATGAYTFEWVSAWQAQGDPTYIELFSGSSREIVCSPARGNRPATTAYLEWYRYGFGEGTLTVGRNYSTASATGTIDVWTDTYDGCTGEYTSSLASGVAVSMELVGSGSLIMERGTWSFKIPGEYNSHSTYSTTYRAATGTTTVDGATNDVYGAIGKVTWKDHFNG